MHYARGFITGTHVRSAVVVEVDVALYHAFAARLDGLEQPLPIEAFHFNYPIDTFRHGIVRGLVVFRHADGNAMPPKAIHVASQQYCTPRSEWCIRPSRFSLPVISTARSMACRNASSVAEARKPISQYPSHYLMGISIRDQMQVTDVSAGKRYIGNIANPQLIGRGWDKALYQFFHLW